jgi:hypothetical protein
MRNWIVAGGPIPLQLVGPAEEFPLPKMENAVMERFVSPQQPPVLAIVLVASQST